MPRETVTRGNHVGLISALPKWAQNEIHRLDDEIVAHKRERDIARRDNDLIDNGQVRAIATSERFVHRSVAVLEGERDWDRIEAYFHEDGSLDVTAPGLAIEPMSGNRVKIHGAVFK